jgi:leader peptidase (prepilin peptidase)/N-methyltransferase
MIVLIDAIAFTLGLAFGSFANVLIFRRGVATSSLNLPSSCVTCGKQILRRNNVPVLSWLWLRGRCRFCQARISRVYPLVELATAGLFVLFANLPSAALVSAFDSLDINRILSAVSVLAVLWWLACAGVALAVIDFQTLRLPNGLILSVAIASVAGLGFSTLMTGDWNALFRALVGVAISGLIYGVIILVSPSGMGLGDLKLAMVLGFYLGWFGWGALFMGLLLAFILGSIFGLALIVARRAQKRTAIAFGPWMILGAFLALGFGEHLWTSYLQFLQRALF